MHIWRRLCEIHLSFCLSNDRLYFFSGRNIIKKCIVSRKSWYIMLDLAQNPVYSVFFPDIFNFDYSLNHSYLTLNKNMTNSYSLRTFNYFDSRDTGLYVYFPRPPLCSMKNSQIPRASTLSSSEIPLN